MRNFRSRCGALTLAMVMAVGMNGVFSTTMHASTLTPVQISAICAKVAALEAQAATITNPYLKQIALATLEALEKYVGGCGE